MGRLAASLSDLKKRLNLRWLDENRPDLEGQKDPRDEDLEQERMQEKYGAESFKPPASAISNAKRGLELRKRWGRGGLSPSEAKSQGIDSGVTRARKIASGKVSQHDVRRMSAFNRHRKNYRPDKKMPDGGPTAGTIAWLLWGGTSGVNWAKKKSAAMNAEDVPMTDWKNYPGELPEQYPHRRPRKSGRGTEPIAGPDRKAYGEEKRRRLKARSPTLTVTKVEPSKTTPTMNDITFENGLVAGYPSSKNAKVGDKFVVANFDGMFPKIMDAEDYGVSGVWMSEDSYDEVRELGCPICSHSLKTVSASAECPMCEVLWHYHQDDGFSYFEAEGDFGDEFAVEFDDWAESFDAETSETFCSECGCSHEDSENFSAEGAGGTQVFNSCWKCGSGLHLYQITRYPATPSEIAGVGGDPNQASDEGRRRA